MFRLSLTTQLQSGGRLASLRLADSAACAMSSRRLLSSVARPLLAAAAGSTSAVPAATPAAATSFGPKRVTASRVPISKRAQRAAAEAAAAAAAAAKSAQSSSNAVPASAGAAAKPSPPSSSKPSSAASVSAAPSVLPDDVDQSFLAPPKPSSRNKGNSASNATNISAASTSSSAAATAPAQKLSPSELAAQFPWSRNLSANQPASTSDSNTYVSETWFMTPEMEASPRPQMYTVPASRFTPAAAPSARAGSSVPVAPRTAGEIVHQLPEAYIASVSHLLQFQRYLSRTSVVSVDTEFVSAFRYRPRLELIQVATPEMLGVIDVSLLRGCPEFSVFLRELLSKEWIVHAHRGDLEVVSDLAASLGFAPEDRVPAGLFDTQVAWSFLAPLPAIGLASMLSELFPGFTIDKSATLSDWTLRPLTRKQISYALGDVQFLMESRRMLELALQQSTPQRSALKDVLSARSAQTAEAAAAGADVGPRLSWFREEMRLLLNPLLYARSDPALAYTALWGGRKFDDGSAGLLVFQSLAYWREVLASRLDQSPARLLSNEQLQSIAESPPGSTDELSQVPNMKRYTVAQWGAEILAVVNAALAKHAASTASTTAAATTTDAAAATTGKDGSAAPSATSSRILIGTAPSALPSVFPVLPLSHRDASRLHWELYSLFSSLVESRSRSVGISPFVMAPRRDMLDLAAVTPKAIRTAQQWNHEGVGVMQSSGCNGNGSADGPVPTGFRPSLMPSAVNYRFAGVSEEMMFDRITADETAEAEHEEEEGETTAAGKEAAEVAAVAAVIDPAPVAAAPLAPGALERVPLSPADELTLLSRSKLLRGWRRQLIGEDLLRITEGAPVAWEWRQEAEGLGEAKIKSG